VVFVVSIAIEADISAAPEPKTRDDFVAART